MGLNECKSRQKVCEIWGIVEKRRPQSPRSRNRPLRKIRGNWANTGKNGSDKRGKCLISNGITRPKKRR